MGDDDTTDQVSMTRGSVGVDDAERLGAFIRRASA